MKPILNVIGVVGGATGIAATVVGIFWLQLYNTFKPLIVIPYDPGYALFPFVTLIFVAVASATLVLLGVSYMNLKHYAGIAGAIRNSRRIYKRRRMAVKHESNFKYEHNSIPDANICR